MTAKELKELLANEPDDKLIINGHEGEYNDINGKLNVEIIPNGNKNIWYLGSHVHVHEQTPTEEKSKAVIALLLQ